MLIQIKKKKKKIETVEINISLLGRNLELCQQIWYYHGESYWYGISI